MNDDQVESIIAAYKIMLAQEFTVYDGAPFTTVANKAKLHRIFHKLFQNEKLLKRLAPERIEPTKACLKKYATYWRKVSLLPY